VPSIKRSGVKSEVVKTGFEAYDGPEPTKRGMYRTRITSFKYKEFKSKAMGFQITGVLEAAAGDPKDHAQFDGYPITGRIVFGDKEMMIARESNLYAALGVPNEPNVVFEGDPTDQSGAKVTKIGNKNPIDQIVNFDIKQSEYLGEQRPEVDGIYKVKASEGGNGKGVSFPTDEPDEDEPAEDEADLMEPEDGDGEEVDDEEFQTRAAELDGLGIVALRKEAKSVVEGIDTKGLSKDDLVEAILDVEFPADPPMASDDSDEEPDDEEEADDDEAEDDEAEDDEEEDDEEPDESDERRAELADFTRVQLKTALKAVNEEFKVLKRHTDDDLREAIIAAEFGEAGDDTPF
jgi:hypothetical protein